MIYLLVGYMWLFIHRPFEVWPWLAEYRIERVYMVVTLAYWALFATKTWTPNRVNWGIGLLLLSMLLSTAFSPYTDFSNKALEDWLKVLVFYGLVMTSVRDERDLKILVVAFVAITGVYQLHSLREYLCGRGRYMMGTWRMTGVDSTLGHPNALAASVNYAIPMLYPVMVLAKRKWQVAAVWGLFALACACIFLSGSRTGFAGFALLLVGCAAVSRHRFKLALVLLLCAPLVWMSLSDDLQRRYETLINPEAGPANAQASAESRWTYFKLGIELWKANPVFGIGPDCFRRVNPTGQPSHVLYAQILSNLGTVGFIAWLVLVFAYMGNFFEGRRLACSLPPPEGEFCRRVCVATTVGLFQLMFLGLGGHNLFWYHWLWFGAFSALALRFLRQRAQALACEGHGFPFFDYKTPVSSLETSVVNM